jgi:hypothetical protein
MPTLDEVLSLSREDAFEFNIETKSFPDKPQYTPSPEEFVRLFLDQVRKPGADYFAALHARHEGKSAGRAQSGHPGCTLDGEYAGRLGPHDGSRRRRHHFGRPSGFDRLSAVEGPAL